jgi:hypothetical protein
MCSTLCDKVCQWLVTGRWFSPGNRVSSTNETNRHDITEISLKVTLNTIIINLFLLLYNFCKGKRGARPFFCISCICWYITAPAYKIYISQNDHWWRKPVYPEKTTDLLQVIDKLYGILLYRVPLAWAGLKLTMLVVIGTDSTNSSNIKTTTPKNKQQLIKQQSD